LTVTQSEKARHGLSKLFVKFQNIYKIAIKTAIHRTSNYRLCILLDQPEEPVSIQALKIQGTHEV